MIKVKRLHPAAKLPTRSYHSAGYDLYASETTDCPPGKVTPVPTGIATEIPQLTPVWCGIVAAWARRA